MSIEERLKFWENLVSIAKKELGEEYIKAGNNINSRFWFSFYKQGIDEAEEFLNKTNNYLNETKKELKQSKMSIVDYYK